MSLETFWFIVVAFFFDLALPNADFVAAFVVPILGVSLTDPLRWYCRAPTTHTPRSSHVSPALGRRSRRPYRWALVAPDRR